jgi:hypothetical protein
MKMKINNESKMVEKNLDLLIHGFDTVQCAYLNVPI